MTEETLYERLGGWAAVAAVVDIFYDRLLADPRLAQVFDGIDMNRLKNHQVIFVSAATGGPEPTQPFDLVAAHRPLNITDEQFDLVAGHLVASLRVAAVEQPLIDEVMGAVAPLRPQIVSAFPAVAG
jgi:hemoglobin